MIYLPINFVHWSSSPSAIFFLWLAVAVSFHRMPCTMPPWARFAVRHWRWSDHHLRVYRVQTWASLSLDDSTLNNILQKSSIFTLEQFWTFLVVFFIIIPQPKSIGSTSSSPRALEPWTNTISSDTNCRVHNTGYHTYYDTNVRRFGDPHRQPQTRMGSTTSSTQDEY